MPRLKLTVSEVLQRVKIAKRKINSKELVASFKPDKKATEKVPVVLKEIQAVATKVYPRSKRRPEHFTDKTKALAMHLCGASIEEAAAFFGISPQGLNDFKGAFINRSPDFGRFVENLLLQSSHDALQIFHKKKNDMSGYQAGMVAGVLAEKAIKMQAVRRSEDREDKKLELGIKEKQEGNSEETIPLSMLERIAGILDSAKKVKGRTIDVVGES